MKLRKTLLSFACAIMVALSFTACGDDWGRAGRSCWRQIYPSKTTVARLMTLSIQKRNLSIQT